MSATPPPTVTIASSGDTYACLEGRSVLVGMEQQGRHGIQVGCRSGGCGVCRVEVLSGTFIAKKMSKAFVAEDDLARGIVLSCRIFPTSDLVVRPCPKVTTSPPGSPVPGPAPDPSIQPAQ